MSSVNIQCTKTGQSVNLFSGNFDKEEEKKEEAMLTKGEPVSGRKQPDSKLLIQYLEATSKVWVYNLEEVTRSEVAVA